MPNQYIPRMINLEPSDYQVVHRVADVRGLGDKGFSAAMRMIIREWQGFQLQELNRMKAEELHRILIDIGIIDRPEPF